MVSTATLKKIALGGFVLVGGCGILVKSRIRKNFCQQDFYLKPLTVLENYKTGADILGRPIGVKKVDLADRNNWTDGLQAQVAIPLTGSLTTGTLYAWSSRPEPSAEWRVDKADLSVQNKRWTFYLHPAARDRHTPTSETTDKTSEDGKLTDNTTRDTPELSTAT